MNSVLVTDGNARSALSVVRSLGNKKIKVDVSTETFLSVAGSSKYCNSKYWYPLPQEDPLRFINKIRSLINKYNFEMIIPLTEYTGIPLSRFRKKLPKKAILPLASHSKIMQLEDKSETLKLAEESRVPYPNTCIIEKRSDIKKAKKVIKNIEGGIILKPAMSSGSRGLVYLRDKKKVMSAYNKLSIKYKKILLQEFIPSRKKTYGVSLLYDNDSRLKASFVHDSLREFPLTGGPSILRESIKYPLLVKLTKRILDRIGWSGVAHAEFKIDERDGKPKLMEINPRFWGSLELAVKAGVDFPYLLYKIAREEKFRSVHTYKSGIKCRWLLPGDLIHLMHTPHNLKKIKEFVKFFEKDLHYDIISIKDPMPTISSIILMARQTFDKEKREWAIKRT